MSRADRWSALSHLAGAILATAGTIALVAVAAVAGDQLKVTAMLIYGVTLITLYLSSTLYHSASGTTKPLFRTLDHVAIYLLIAGTYTPFMLGPLRGPLGMWLLGIVWTLAALGIAQELYGLDRRRILSVVMYLGMGWLVVLAAGPLTRALPVGALVGLLGGGLAYTVGIAFYACDHRWPTAHVIWHGFVLAGSILHFVVIARYLV